VPFAAGIHAFVFVDRPPALPTCSIRRSRWLMAIGTLAAQILFRRIDGDTSEVRPHIVPTRLVGRGSGEIPAS
jgi:DNA-binding LacI/PurR family transcriptional regulator